MDTEHSPIDHGRSSAERLRSLCDTAEVFAKTLDLKRNPSAHIAQALRGVPVGAQRDQLFGEIRRELAKRERARQVKQAQGHEDLDEAEEARSRADHQRMYRDAYAHQMSQPRDAWDPNADDEK
ncbi:hypothetical protein HY631_03635 [Candidatus Uhrbacteria bacterium]|nr:hypothetical protein [Candidatus Uhrbacteria bacterium]